MFVVLKGICIPEVQGLERSLFLKFTVKREIYDCGSWSREGFITEIHDQEGNF